jgi:drug/metabolite transporter (DMT)-like permease
MFIGESGCWLVMGLMALYNKYKDRQSPNRNAYTPITTIDREVESDASETTLLNPSNGSAQSTDAAKREYVLSGFRVLLLSLPAIADICGTTLMNVGLLMVAASIFQMTRGALVLFVGLFSVVFLRRKLHLYQWVSLVGVMTGVALVGLAGAISPDTKAKATSTYDLVRRAMEDPVTSDAVRAVIGVLLIAGAQIFTATQFVLEEWILERSPIDPIRIVAWEGTFGLIVTLIGMVVLHLAVGRTDAGRLGMFDMVEGFRQMFAHKAVLISSFLIMISIG